MRAGLALSVAAARWAARFYLRLAFREPGLAELSGRERWQALTTGIERRPRDFWFQFIVLAVAFAALDLLPNAAVTFWVSDERRELVSSVLVSVKNPTVIAFTIIWMLGVGRTLIVGGRRAAVPGAR